MQVLELAEADAEAEADAGGIVRAWRRRVRPCVVNSTFMVRSSVALRNRVIKPSAWSRLSIGDNVAESICSSAAICFTDSGGALDFSLSQSASITRYWGWVSPSGSSSGRYTASTARLVTASAKHTWRSSDSGSTSAATALVVMPPS